MTMHKHKKILITAAAAVIVLAAAATAWFMIHRAESLSEGAKRFALKEVCLEKNGIAAITQQIRTAAEVPDSAYIAYFEAWLTKDGFVENFKMTLDAFDDQGNYTQTYTYNYNDSKHEIVCGSSVTTILPTYEQPNSALDYIDAQIKTLPLASQMQLLDFEHFTLVFQPDIQLEAGTPVIEADSSGQFPLLSYEDYQQGLGGVSDGSSSVIISLTDGTGATGQQIRYLCQAADEESLSGNPETTMQSDYRIQNGELYLTGDCGETWISAGLSEAQLQETLETYHMGNILAQDSFYADGSGTYMFFYGKIPTLKITEDSGSTWREITFDREMPRTVTRRIIRFLDDENGYAALGTDWSMGTGEALFLYWTHDGGQTWEELELPTVDGQMLGGIAFADTQAGILTVERVSAEDPWLVTYYTEDGGKNFETLELPWEDIPEEVQYLSRVDSLTYEDGQYVLIMGQGLSGNQKVKFTSQSVDSGWQFEENYIGTVHTVG